MYKMTARNLGEVADFFDTLASDQLRAIPNKTAKGKRECEIRAEVYQDAAEILRKTEIITIEAAECRVIE